jgi:hypothetical protein
MGREIRNSGNFGQKMFVFMVKVFYRNLSKKKIISYQRRQFNSGARPTGNCITKCTKQRNVHWTVQYLFGTVRRYTVLLKTEVESYNRIF